MKNHTIKTVVFFTLSFLGIQASTTIVVDNKEENSVLDNVQKTCLSAAHAAWSGVTYTAQVAKDEVAAGVQATREELVNGARFTLRWAIPTMAVAAVVYITCIRPLQSGLDKLPGVADKFGDKLEKIAENAGKEAAAHLLENAAKNIDLPQAAQNLALKDAAEAVGYKAAEQLPHVAENLALAKVAEQLPKAVEKFELAKAAEVLGQKAVERLPQVAANLKLFSGGNSAARKGLVNLPWVK